MKEVFSTKFQSRDRAEWESIFDGTDACCTPVLTQDELKKSGYDQRPIVTLRDSPGRAISETEADDRPAAEGQGIGTEGEGWSSRGMRPGDGGEEMLAKWMGWRQGRHYDMVNGGLEKLDRGAKL